MSGSMLGSINHFLYFVTFIFVDSACGGVFEGEGVGVHGAIHEKHERVERPVVKMVVAQTTGVSISVQH